MTSTDLSTITDVDLDATPKCEGPRCTRDAEVALTTRCCGAVVLGCRPCRDHLREQIDIRIQAGRSTCCHFCRSEITSWSGFVREVSL